MDLVTLNKKAYNAIAGHFSATRNKLWPEFNEFTSFLAPGQRVLDWGCGNGRLVYMLETLPTTTYVGVDQSVGLLDEAKKIHAAGIKNGRVQFIDSSNGEPEFSKEYFDLVFMIASFFHLADAASRKKLLTKTFDELKPGGRLCMTLWNLESDWAKEKKPHWQELGPNDYLIPWKDQSGKVVAERYYHHFTKEEIRNLLVESGFEIEKISDTATTNVTGEGNRNMIVVAKKPN